jgi:phosphatidylglycerophosphatase A
MRAARFIASGGGAGFSPRAPGTAGSVVGVAIGAALLVVSPWLLGAGIVAAVAGGVVAARSAAGLAWMGSAKGEDDDPSWVVIDEIAGQMIALLALPRPDWMGVAAAFLLFRLFDIWKPGPIGWADRQVGTFGVMADDVLAGLLAWALLVLGRASF